MATLELKVVDKTKGLASQKSFFTVVYGDKEIKVPMYNFQEAEEMPETLRCVEKAGKITGIDPEILTDKFYANNAEYIFRIKNVWPSYKYYEIEDIRFHEDFTVKLTYADSANDLTKGQQIRCVVKVQGEGRISARMVERNPSLIQFRSFEQIFDSEKLVTWLESLQQKRFMEKAFQMYKAQDGRWIYLFAQNFEDVVCTLISSTAPDKAQMLQHFCTRWLKAIERSTFISDMTAAEAANYNHDLAVSIEMCEDMLEAVYATDQKEKTADRIESLNPAYYQYRIEKRFRFLACVLCLNPELLESSIVDFMDRLKQMGEESCRRPIIGKLVAVILHTYALLANHKLDAKLSFDTEDTKVVKQCALALSYLIKLKNGEPDEQLYISRLYQMLANASTFKEEERILMLRNSYKALFSTKNPLASYKWEHLEDIIRNEPYRFTQTTIEADTNRALTYEDGSTAITLQPKQITLAPLRTEAKDLASLDMPAGTDLTLSLCHDRSISKLSQDDSFLHIQNVWNNVEASVFAPAVKLKETIKMNELTDGQDVDIYVTDILNPTTILCKVAGYGGEEGTMLFNDLFFYKSPMLTIEDFRGPDSSPLLIPARCVIENSQLTFNSTEYKLEFAQNNMPGDQTLCCIIQKKPNGYCTAITKDGFFVNFYATDSEMVPSSFVLADIYETNNNGYGQADAVELTDQTFDNSRTYAKYIANLNKYYFSENDEVVTLLSDQKNQEQQPVEEEKHDDAHRLTTEEVRNAARIVYKMSGYERNMRTRYGYLFTCGLIHKLINEETEHQLFGVRTKYARLLHSFSINTQVIENDLNAFWQEVADHGNAADLPSRLNVAKILNRYHKHYFSHGVDNVLIGFQNPTSTPLEKELSRLVLSANMLSEFKNKAIEAELLEELSDILMIDILKKEAIHIGEEGQTCEFKTSIVFPPNNRGNENIEQQSDNIIRVILSMMNARGGVLYIGVNDEGNVIGLQNDFNYFSENKYDEHKCRDLFKNYFSCLLTERLGADRASRFDYDFEEVGGYVIFKVNIPEIHNADNIYVRVGSTSQRV